MGAILTFAITADLCLNNLTLEKAESIAREYNPQYLIAEEEVIQAEERRGGALSHWFPSIYYRAQYQQTQEPELFLDIYALTFGLKNHGYSSIFDLNQPLFSPHLYFDFRAKGFEQSAARFKKAKTLNDLLFAIRRNFYSVILYESTLDIRRETVDYLTYALEIVQRRLEAGSSIPLELNRSKAAVANAISSYYTSLRDFKTSRNSLVLTLGVDPLLEPQMSIESVRFPLDSIPEISLKLQELEQSYRYRQIGFPSVSDFTQQIDRIEEAKQLVLFTEEEVANYLAFAESHRPILLQTQQEVEASSQVLKMKQGTYLPEVAAYVRFSYNDNQLGPKPFQEEPYNWVGGISLNWKLFDSFAREHEIKEARAYKRAQQYAHREALLRVEIEVRNSLYNLEEALLSYASAQEAVAVAEEAVHDAKEKLTFGKIPLLDFRDAVNALALARDQKNQASFALMNAYYSLRFSIGSDANP